MNLFELGIQNAGEFHFLSLETMYQVGAIEPEDVFSRRQDQIASQMFNAIHRTGIGGAAHGLGFEHLLMRAREGMNIQGALAVGDLAAEDLGVLAVSRARRGKNPY